MEHSLVHSLRRTNLPIIIVIKISIFGALLLHGRPVIGQGMDFAVQYSYLHSSTNLTTARPFDLNGGGGSFTIFLNDWVGFKTELDAYASTLLYFKDAPKAFPVSGNLQTYMAGVEIKARQTTLRPFAHALFGIASTDALDNLARAQGLTNMNTHDDGFALAAGAGIELSSEDSHFSVRIAEFDYLLARLSNPRIGAHNLNNVRFQAGVVFSF